MLAWGGSILRASGILQADEEDQAMGGGSAMPRSSAMPTSRSNQDDEKDSSTAEGSGGLNSREKKFEDALNAENVDLDALKKLSWCGVPRQYRWLVWTLVIGYCPSNKVRRENALRRKREEYRQYVKQHCESDSERTDSEEKLRNQILKDLNRLLPDTPVFHNERVQLAMERILFIWAIRNPASAYVQGMDGFVATWFLVCLHEHCDKPELCDVEPLWKSGVLEQIEADTFWCVGKLLQRMHSHYTPGQPGIQRMIFQLEELVRRTDTALHNHLVEENLQFMQFAFRWMNCLLMRDVPLPAIIRLWDTYLVEERGFEQFHVYVCASFLLSWSSHLMQMEFEELMKFVQKLPTEQWGAVEADTLLSQAFMLSTYFQGSPNHLM